MITTVILVGLLSLSAAVQGQQYDDLDMGGVRGGAGGSLNFGTMIGSLGTMSRFLGSAGNMNLHGGRGVHSQRRQYTHTYNPRQTIYGQQTREQMYAKTRNVYGQENTSQIYGIMQTPNRQGNMGRQYGDQQGQKYGGSQNGFGNGQMMGGLDKLGSSNSFGMGRVGGMNSFGGMISFGGMDSFGGSKKSLRSY